MTDIHIDLRDRQSKAKLNGGTVSLERCPKVFRSETVRQIRRMRQAFGLITSFLTRDHIGGITHHSALLVALSLPVVFAARQVDAQKPVNQDDSTGSPGSSSAKVNFDNPVLAYVDDKPVYFGPVQFQVRQALRDREVDKRTLERMYAQALEQMISRQLILDYLDENKLGATAADVDLAIHRIEQELKGNGKSLKMYLAETQQDLAGLRHSIQWQLGWQKYLDAYLTDENLASFFSKHQRDFDGTQLRVAHILWKPQEGESAEAWTELRDEANRIRAAIIAGKTDFSEAAKTHSISLSGQAGGEIGWIGRSGPMIRSFTDAAFQLSEGELSPIVESRFGLHLIRCLEVKPGDKIWSDAREEVRQASILFLFDWVSNKRRTSATIRYTGVTPRFRPGTDEIIPGQRDLTQ